MPIKAVVDDGTVPESVVTDKAVRIVYSLAAVGALDKQNPNNASADATSEQHRLLARRMASSSCVLLKNDGQLLPLSLHPKANATAVKTIALIGKAGAKADEQAGGEAIFGGGGSGKVVRRGGPSLSLCRLQVTLFH